MVLAVSGFAASIELPAVFGDNMILQRESQVPVWGRAKPDIKVDVSIAGQKASTRAGKSGFWKLSLSPLPAGGPHKMIIQAGNETLTFKNVLIGEVWLCSGQSNMKFPLSSCDGGKETAARASNPRIRLFTVPLKSADNPQAKMASTRRKDYRRWLECSPKTSINFSGLGIFFALDLYKKLNIPIGIIDCSYGGTKAEAWTDPAKLNTPALKPIMQSYAVELKKFPGLRKEYDSHMAAYQKLGRLKRKTIASKDTDSGNDPNGYSKINFNDNTWNKCILRYTPRREVRWTGGTVIWLRFTTFIPNDWKNKKLQLTNLSVPGNVVIFCNGIKLAQYSGPEYHKINADIPAQATGSNKVVITLRSFTNAKCGALLGVPRLICPGKKANVFLKGVWRWHAEKSPEKTQVGVYPYVFPPVGPGHKDAIGGLYNAMIFPLAPYAVRGVLWYQGEGNHSKPRQYRELLPAMIKCWRELWHDSRLPFIVVQLPNYGQPASKPSQKSYWAELREAQQMTAADDPDTSLVVTIDVGDANNMHPKNKKDVARRALLATWKNVYHKTKDGDSPVYKDMEISGGKVIVKIKNDGKRLLCKGDKINGFMLAGKNMVFYRANAEMLSDNRLAVSSPSVPQPVAVRYAWADNPENCNIYNNNDLPLTPFRSDTPEKERAKK